MLPWPLIPETRHSLIIVHPAVVLAVPGPSVGRLKCSWHLGMMMRIIETPLLKGKPASTFEARKALLLKNTLTKFPGSGRPVDPTQQRFEANLFAAFLYASCAIDQPRRSVYDCPATLLWLHRKKSLHVKTSHSLWVHDLATVRGLDWSRRPTWIRFWFELDLLPPPIDCVSDFLSTTGSVVPVDSHPERD
jgi:hypothetical protein